MNQKESGETQTPPASFLEVLTAHRQWSGVKRICDRLNSAGYDAVLAGGCVRDALLGVPPKDFDVATSATPDQVEATFERTIAVGKNFGVIVVTSDDCGPIEVATYRRDGDYEDGRRPTGVIFSDRHEDAQRRDFTVNALFYDPRANEIIDYVGGRDDLKNRILRVVGEPERRFREDKLRLLRAVRFSGQLDFPIEAATEDAVRHHAKELSAVSRERIRDEIDKLLQARGRDRGFEALEAQGLGEPVFEDWAAFILPPSDLPSDLSDLDLLRILLFYPALKRASPDRLQERLRAWKYGRAFVELAMWMIKNEDHLRTRSPDPKPHLLSRPLILQKFEVTPFENGEHHEQRLYSDFEREWMTSLELWTDERAQKACAALDIIYGPDLERDRALLRRGLELGEPDRSRAKAEELLNLPGGAALQGAGLGRELRRLNREILLR